MPAKEAKKEILKVEAQPKVIPEKLVEAPKPQAQAVIPEKKPEPAVQPEEDLKDFRLEQVLKVNVKRVDFGDVMPGQIIEESIVIMNNLNNTKVPFKIKINCLTKEFDELDEYVYSMRRPSQNDNFNYNDTFLILLTQKAISYYKLAIKVPSVRDEKDIIGNIEITSQETKPDPIIIPIKSKIILPNVKCEKMMMLKSLKMHVVKLFMKQLKRQEFRLSLKNVTKLPCNVDLVMLKNDATTGFLEFIFYPSQLNLAPQISTTFMMTIKCSANEEDVACKEFRSLLIVKLKNSSAIFSYPVVIVMGDGKVENTKLIS